MEPVFKPKPWQGTYLVLLTPEILLCATSDAYLKELLERVDIPPADRALPDALAEWKHIDPSAPAWMIRHIPHENAKRVVDGVTWSLNKDRLDIEYFPVADAAAQVETQARTRWQSPGIEPKAEFRHSAEGAVIVTLNTNTAGPHTFLATLFLYALQNESGAVGAQ